MISGIGICTATLLADFDAPHGDDIRQAAEVALEAGAAAVSLWTPHLDLLGGAEKAAAWFSSAGMRIEALEAAVAWPKGEPAAVLAEARTFARLVETVGATKLLAVTMEESLDDLARASDNLALLVDQVSAAGAQTCVEFLPWSGIPDLATAWKIVEPVGSGAGIVVGTWHWQRQPGGPNLRLLAQIPGERIGYVQLCDAARGDGRDMAEAMLGRLLPGEGVVDFPGLFKTLTDIAADPFIATEVFNGAQLAEMGQANFAAASIKSAEVIAGAFAA